MREAPQFIERDADKITHEMVTQYEALSGKTLYPAQIERLLIDIIAYRETLVREAIQDAACQNLVNFARAPMLDELGALVGCHRLGAQKAEAVFEATLKAVQSTPYLIMAGTTIKTADESIIFETLDNVVIAAGQLSVQVRAVCTQPGVNGNGLLSGKVSIFATNLSALDRFRNITVTAGGSDEESDNFYRERIKLAPETFSVAGSTGAYRYHALSAHPDIKDVAITSPVAGEVKIYPLTKTGLPEKHILDKVYETCSHEKVRPLTDQVEVKSPVPIHYDIKASIVLYENADQDSTMDAVKEAAESYERLMVSSLGKDIVPSQIIAMLSVAGVYEVKLQAPAATKIVLDHEWPQCDSIQIGYEGVAYG